MIYFARGGRLNSPTKGSWTAISRAPWLKAIVLYGKGDCWLGGGLFTKPAEKRRPGTYWLNGACMHFPLQQATEMVEDTSFVPEGGRGGECLSVYYPRLLRDGWNLVSKLSEVRFDSCDLFEKPLANGWVLRKFAHAQVGAAEGKSCYWDEHELENARLGVRIEKPDWEWAERDAVTRGGETIVWAEKGGSIGCPRLRKVWANRKCCSTRTVCGLRRSRPLIELYLKTAGKEGPRWLLISSS